MTCESVRRTGEWWRTLPAWAADRVGDAEADAETLRLDTGHDVHFTRRVSPAWSALTAVADVGHAGKIDRIAERVYAEVTQRVADVKGQDPVRFWNFIPAIHAAAGEGLDQYRAFNIGRHSALMRWYGSQEAFARGLPTATGVGHDGRELVVHCLTWRGTRRGIENPRQRPAYQYSAKFGPVGPSFARATLIEHDNVRELVIGGTASVLGEDSVHLGDVEAQFNETLVNLRSLIAHAGADDVIDPLARLRDVRVYHVRPDDAPRLSRRFEPFLPRDARVEFVRADICRPELLIEIEGVADLGETVA